MDLDDTRASTVVMLQIRIEISSLSVRIKTASSMSRNLLFRKSFVKNMGGNVRVKSICTST